MDNPRDIVFESAGPSAVKSIKQRDFLNTWLRLYAHDQQLPRLADYRPERIEDEVADIVYYSVDAGRDKLPRVVIESQGARLANAYGKIGGGQDLDIFLGAKLAPVVMPIYYECIRRRLPIYTISKVVDSRGRDVDYERLLLPFSDGDSVTRILASLKTISEDGGFEISNLLRGSDALPVFALGCVIDRDLFHAKPAGGCASDIIEFN